MVIFNCWYISNFLLLFFISAINGEYTKAYFPISNSTKFPRLRLVGTLPELHEFTFCSWIRIYSMTNRSPFIFSYATTVSDNEIAFLLHNSGNQLMARLHIGAPLIDFRCSMLDSQQESWNHICVTWFAPNGRTNVFVNNYNCTPATGLQVSPGGRVRSGGVAIIGQDQDAVDSKFDHTQAWYGNIADVQLWDEVLSRHQIEEAGTCGGKRKRGNIIAWLKTPMRAVDGAVFAETQLCQP